MSAATSSPSAPNALLVGPILPTLLRFALPNMGAMLATALAAVAETSYVGRFGSPALAGMALVVTFAPDLWTTLYTRDEAVLQSARSYFLWAGPCYGFFGLGLSLYFSSLGAGKALGPVLAGTLRLVLVVVGGALLAWSHAPAWAIFALVGAGMDIYGVSSVLIVRKSDW